VVTYGPGQSYYQCKWGTGLSVITVNEQRLTPAQLASGGCNLVGGSNPTPLAQLGQLGCLWFTPTTAADYAAGFPATATTFFQSGGLSFNLVWSGPPNELQLGKAGAEQLSTIIRDLVAGTSSTSPLTTAVPPATSVNPLLAAAGPGSVASPITTRGSIAWLAISETPGWLASGYGHGTAEVRIYKFVAGEWVEEALVPLTAYGGAGQSNPGSTPITPGSLTGGAAPDFLVATILGAGTPVGSVVSDLNGQWMPVPFGTGTGRSIAVETASVSGDEVVSEVNDCTPDCADGSYTVVHYRFDPSAVAFVQSST